MDNKDHDTDEKQSYLLSVAHLSIMVVSSTFRTNSWSWKGKFPLTKQTNPSVRRNTLLSVGPFKTLQTTTRLKPFAQVQNEAGDRWSDCLYISLVIEPSQTWGFVHCMNQEVAARRAVTLVWRLLIGRTDPSPRHVTVAQVKTRWRVTSSSSWISRVPVSTKWEIVYFALQNSFSGTDPDLDPRDWSTNAAVAVMPFRGSVSMLGVAST